MRPSSRWLSIATMVLLTLIWGTTWAAIRISLEGIPPLAGVALRFGIAGLLLLAIAGFLRVPLGGSRCVRRLWVVNGVTTFAVAYGITYWAEQWIPSSLASILFATFPLFVALMAHFFLPNERLQPRGALGAVVGFGGVVVIFSEDLAGLGGDKVLVASLVMLAAPFSSAIGQIVIKRFGQGVHPLNLTAPPMLLAAALMGGLALGFERGATFDFGWAPTWALLYLAVVGSAVTFTLYFWLLSKHSATGVSLMAYAIPVVAVMVGALFLDEVLTARVLVGSGLVIAGTALAA